VGPGRAVFVGVVVAGFVGSADAAEYHVTPGGAAAGDGSMQAPWDLNTALNSGEVVGPGDTIWVHAGTYGDGGPLPFESNLYGATDQPVIVRQAPGERATIDGGIAAYGGWTWFWDLEITNSRPQRSVQSEAGTPDARVSGLFMAGAGHRAINLVVHNTGHPGIGFWQVTGPEAEVYGCILWGNGIYDPLFPRRGSGATASIRISSPRASTRSAISWRSATSRSVCIFRPTAAGTSTAMC
jgi:hypothetical protein